MGASEPVTLSTPPINAVARRASARLMESSSAAVQNIAKAMPKAFVQAGTGVAANGVKAAKRREAACSRGVGCTFGGTSKAESAVKGLEAATRAKKGKKAEPVKAAAAVRFKEPTAAAEAAMPQRDQDQQEPHGCGRVIKNSSMVIAPHLVQFLSPNRLAPLSGCVHCNRVYIPKHVIGWYPGLHHGSPLHLQVKVPAAAEELALRGGTCNLELGETRTSLAPVGGAPVGEDPILIEGGAVKSVHTKLVLALVGTLAIYNTARQHCFVGQPQTLDHFVGWRIVCMQKVSICLNRLE